MKGTAQFGTYESICKKHLDHYTKTTGKPYTPLDLYFCMYDLSEYEKSLKPDWCTILNLNEITYDNEVLNHFSPEYLLKTGGSELVNLVLGDNII